jgi:hypothetical protein
LGNASTGPGGAADNGPIKYAGDKSGKGRHATNNGADSVCPTLVPNALNSRPALSFDGGDGLSGGWNLTLTSETTIAVGKINATSGIGARIFTQSDASLDSSTSGHYIPILDRISARAPFASWSDGAARAAVTASAGTDNVMVSRHTGSVINNSINGGAEQTYSHTLNKSWTRYLIGFDTAGSGRLNGNIYELLVYSRSLSTTELKSVVRYLGQKWGITVS